MIVPPRLLTACLDDVDHQEQRRLSLLFAGHMVELAESAEPREAPELLARLRSALDCATRTLGDETQIEELASRARRLLDEESQTDGLVTVVRLAIKAALQRELEASGHLKPNRYQPTVQDIVQMAQALRGKMAGADPIDGRRARWEEARWQLVQLIERAPFPEPTQGDG